MSQFNVGGGELCPQSFGDQEPAPHPLILRVCQQRRGTSTEDRLVSFVRSKPGNVTVTLPKLWTRIPACGCTPAREAGRNSLDVCLGKEEQSWGVHDGVSTCRVTSRVGGKRGDGDRGGPRSVSTVSRQDLRSCPHIYSRAGPKGETDYRDVRWTRSLKGTVELHRGQEAAVRLPGLEEQGGGYPETRDCSPPGTGGQRETGYFLETRKWPPPLMPLGTCWNLIRWAEQEPLGTARPCPLLTSNGHSSPGAAGVAGKTGRRTNVGLRATR